MSVRGIIEDVSAPRAIRSSHAVVVGAGPVGSAAAVALAAHGVSVTLIEADDFKNKAATSGSSPVNRIGTAPQAEAQLAHVIQRRGAKALSKLPGLLGIVRSYASRAEGTFVISNKPGAEGELLSYALGAGGGARQAGAVRYDVLVNAMRAGASAQRRVVPLMQTRVEGITFGDDGWMRLLLRTSSGRTSMRTRFIIGCDGASSTVANALRLATRDGSYVKSLSLSPDIKESEAAIVAVGSSTKSTDAKKTKVFNTVQPVSRQRESSTTTNSDERSSDTLDSPQITDKANAALSEKDTNEEATVARTEDVEDQSEAVKTTKTVDPAASDNSPEPDNEIHETGSTDGSTVKTTNSTVPSDATGNTEAQESTEVNKEGGVEETQGEVEESGTAKEAETTKVDEKTETINASEASETTETSLSTATVDESTPVDNSEGSEALKTPEDASIVHISESSEAAEAAKKATETEDNDSANTKTSDNTNSASKSEDTDKNMKTESEQTTPISNTALNKNSTKSNASADSSQVNKVSNNTTKVDRKGSEGTNAHKKPGTLTKQMSADEDGIPCIRAISVARTAFTAPAAAEVVVCGEDGVDLLVGPDTGSRTGFIFAKRNHRVWEATGAEAAYAALSGLPIDIRKVVPYSAMRAFAARGGGEPPRAVQVSRAPTLAVSVGKESQGAVLLLGDAAHPLPLDVSTGINAGLEDAGTLYDVMAKASSDMTVRDVAKAYVEARDIDTDALMYVAKRLRRVWRRGAVPRAQFARDYRKSWRQRLAGWMPFWFHPSIVHMAADAVPYNDVLQRDNVTRRRMIYAGATTAVVPAFATATLLRLAFGRKSGDDDDDDDE